MSIESPPAKHRKLASEVVTPTFQLNSPEPDLEFSPPAISINKTDKQNSSSRLAQKNAMLHRPSDYELTYTQQLQEKVAHNYPKVKQYFNNPSDAETESEDSNCGSPLSPALIQLPIKKVRHQPLIPVPPILDETLVDCSIQAPNSELQGDVKFHHCMNC